MAKRAKYLVCEPYIIDIAKWIDEGLNFTQMAEKISEAEHTEVPMNAVYRFAESRGLNKNRKHWNSTQNNRKYGCDYCADAKKCNKTRCRYNDEELNLFRTLIEV